MDDNDNPNEDDNETPHVRNRDPVKIPDPELFGIHGDRPSVKRLLDFEDGDGIVITMRTDGDIFELAGEVTNHHRFYNRGDKNHREFQMDIELDAQHLTSRGGRADAYTLRLSAIETENGWSQLDATIPYYFDSVDTSSGELEQRTQRFDRVIAVHEGERDGPITRKVTTDGGTDGEIHLCSSCGRTLPDEPEDDVGVYCPYCGHGQLLTDGGHLTSDQDLEPFMGEPPDDLTDLFAVEVGDFAVVYMDNDGLGEYVGRTPLLATPMEVIDKFWYGGVYLVEMESDQGGGYVLAFIPEIGRLDVLHMIKPESEDPAPDGELHLYRWNATDETYMGKTGTPTGFKRIRMETDGGTDAESDEDETAGWEGYIRIELSITDNKRGGVETTSETYAMEDDFDGSNPTVEQDYLEEIIRKMGANATSRWIDYRSESK